MEHPGTDDAPQPRRRSRLGRGLGAAGAAAILTAAGFGIAAAQEAPPTTPPPAGSASEAAKAHGEGCDHAGRAKASLDAAATAIGVPVADLRAALRDGRSMADLAREKDVDPVTVVAALVADARERVVAKVAAGDLTQAQADARLADVEQRMTAAVEREGIGHRGRRGGGRAHHGRKARGAVPGGAGAGASATTTA